MYARSYSSWPSRFDYFGNNHYILSLEKTDKYKINGLFFSIFVVFAPPRKQRENEEREKKKQSLTLRIFKDNL